MFKLFEEDTESWKFRTGGLGARLSTSHFTEGKQAQTGSSPVTHHLTAGHLIAGQVLCPLN